MTESGEKVSKGKIPERIKSLHIEYSGDLSQLHELGHTLHVLEDPTAWENLSEEELATSIETVQRAARERVKGSLLEKVNNALNRFIYDEG